MYTNDRLYIFKTFVDHISFGNVIIKEVGFDTNNLSNPVIIPVLYYGEYYHDGWEIPTKYAIDSKKQVWMNDAHGGYLKLTSQVLLFSNCPDLRYDPQICKLLGLNEPRKDLDILCDLVRLIKKLQSQDKCTQDSQELELLLREANAK